MECDLGWGFELDDLALAHPRWPLLDVRGAESGWRLRDLSCAFEGGGLGQPVGVGGQVRDGIEHSGTGCVDGNSKVDSHWSCEVWCGLWLVGMGFGWYGFGRFFHHYFRKRSRRDMERSEVYMQSTTSLMEEGWN